MQTQNQNNQQTKDAWIEKHGRRGVMTHKTVQQADEQQQQQIHYKHWSTGGVSTCAKLLCGFKLTYTLLSPQLTKMV